MDKPFTIRSSDPALLEKARRIATDLIQPYMTEEVAGIVLLGAVARGYFDRSADIDIAMFTRAGVELPLQEKFLQVEGIEVQLWLADIESEIAAAWDMGKRWTYAQGQIVHDPQGQTARLLAEKVPLGADERRWLVMFGCTMAEWYANRLTQTWVERGDIVSAHAMLDAALLYFYEMLFGLNNALVPDTKWRAYCAARLARLPGGFRARVEQVMTLHALSEEELARRRAAFMAMWTEMRPAAEAEAGMTFEEMVKVV